MEKERKEELQSRREFFKKAAQKALPILGVVVLGPSLLSSCSKDDEPDSCKSGCSGSCSDSCSGSCSSGCTDNCSSNCGGDCWGVCWEGVR